MSDTPRTDAEALKWGPHDGVMNVVVPAYFARELERELSAAKYLVNVWRTAFQESTNAPEEDGDWKSRPDGGPA